MSYIRTKDGVYKIDEVKPYFLDEKQKLFINNELKVAINEQRVINQSDTIEELCDEFVYQTGGSISKGKPMISKNDFLSLKEWYVTGGINQNNIFGAIWTDKGLIYVAKFNESGELELI